jgi:hypothetical protein
MKTYTHVQEAVANLPYALMALIGGALLAVSSGGAPWGWWAAGGYVVYAVLGAFWIMVFVCPFCAFFATRSCPCGYGQVAPRLARKSSVECFAVQFRKHIPVIVPLWIIPAAAGGWALYGGFSWLILGLLAAFVADAWIILPLVSRRHGCTECPQKDDCPWMGRTPVKEARG